MTRDRDLYAIEPFAEPRDEILAVSERPSWLRFARELKNEYQGLAVDAGATLADAFLMEQAATGATWAEFSDRAAVAYAGFDPENIDEGATVGKFRTFDLGEAPLVLEDGGLAIRQGLISVDIVKDDFSPTGAGLAATSWALGCDGRMEYQFDLCPGQTGYTTAEEMLTADGRAQRMCRPSVSTHPDGLQVARVPDEHFLELVRKGAGSTLLNDLADAIGRDIIRPEWNERRAQTYREHGASCLQPGTALYAEAMRGNETRGAENIGREGR